MKREKIKELIISGQVISIGIIIPLIIHFFGGAGKVILPMHIPVIIGGFLLSPVYALFVGLCTPLLSSLITGMPPLMPMALIMMIELGCYGLVTSLLSKKVNVYMTIISSMIIGRLASGILIYLLTTFFGIKFAPPLVYLKGALITGIPGIIIQLILIPTIVIGVKKYSPYNSKNNRYI